MRSGTLRHRVELQEPTRAKSESGAPKPTSWRTFRECRASIVPLSGRELLLAKQVEARVTHELRVRKDPSSDVRTSHRVLFKDGARNRVFEVLGVTNTEERDRELVLSCVENVTTTGA